VESTGGPINYSDAAWVARVPFVPPLILHRSATEPGLASFTSSRSYHAQPGGADDVKPLDIIEPAVGEPCVYRSR
jgi:hypothetical protein